MTYIEMDLAGGKSSDLAESKQLDSINRDHGFAVRAEYCGVYTRAPPRCSFARPHTYIGHIPVKPGISGYQYIMEFTVVRLRLDFACDVDWQGEYGQVDFFSLSTTYESLSACFEAFPEFVPRSDLEPQKI